MSDIKGYMGMLGTNVFSVEQSQYSTLTDGTDKFRFGINNSGNFVIENYSTGWQTLYES